MKTNAFKTSVITLCILVGLGNVTASAQGIRNDGANLVIAGGTTVYIDGDANGGYRNETNSSDGAIDLDGTMVVEGDWTNNASNSVFINTDNDGTVTLKGTTTQTVGGTASTAFENLTINNSIAAGTAVDLSLNTVVGSTLTLTDGVVATNANYLIMSSSTAADLQPGTPTSASYVNGNLRRAIATNTSTYAFPVGNGTAATNFYLAELINGNLAGITYIDSKFGPLVVGGTLGVTEAGTDYTSVSTEGVWYLDPDAAPSGGDYDLKCYTANFSGLADNQFTILSRPSISADAADWTCNPCGFGDPGVNANGGVGRMVADGYALRLGMSGFSQKGIGKAEFPLPVELISFYAECEDRQVRIRWATASEVNNDFFTVEKSFNGAEFSTVGIVHGAGTSNHVAYYDLYDADISEMNTYYRLRQTNFDGTFTYSGLVIANCSIAEDEIGFAIMPNPGKDYLNIVLKGSNEEDAVLSIYDEAGKLVYEKTVYGGFKRLTINIGELAPGLYHARLASVAHVFNEKFIKL